MTYYNLDLLQAEHFASLKSGETMTVIVPIEQPPEGYNSCSTKGVTHACFFNVIDPLIYIKLPYPLNARVGMRETWGLQSWGTVTDARVDRVQEVTCTEITHALHYSYMFREEHLDDSVGRCFKDWFNARYKGRFTWDKNPWVEIATILKQ
jgi:hypothetical protein